MLVFRCGLEMSKKLPLLKRLWKSSAGATAIEFAILALPFLMVVFATFETFLAFTGEQLVVNATDVMARKIRTGQITFNTGRATDMTETQFRQAICDQISLLISCSATEAATPSKLYVDLREFSTFANMPKTIPLISTNSGAGKDIDPSGFGFSPGGANSKNMLRVYYRWPIMTDLVRPYISNIQPQGASGNSEFLIVATSAFQNENYP